MIPKTYGKTLCGLTRKKLNVLEGFSPVIRCKSNIAFHKKIIPLVKHAGGSLMFLGCFAASGPEQVSDGTMNFTLCHKVMSGHQFVS